MDLTTAEVTGLFDAASLPSILLKGPTLRRWLFPDGGRPYTDSDLLVPEDRADEARAILAAAGFEPVEEEKVFDDPKHALAWQRPRDGANVDLHVTIRGAGVEPGRVWSALARRTERMTVGGREVDVLDHAGRLFHVALHATQHGSSKTSTHEDVARALRTATREEWQEAVALARELDALEPFRRGLTYASGGDDLVDELGVGRWVPGPPTTRDVLVEEAPGAPVVAGLERLGRVRGLRGKAAFVLYKAFSRETLTIWTPLAARGPAGLWAARLARPFWLLLRLPAALVKLARAARRSRAARMSDGG